MAHGQYASRAFHDLAHRLRLDPGLDSCMPLSARGFAAEELHMSVTVDDRLVAAAAQRHLDGGVGKVVIVIVIVAAGSDADADRHLDLISDMNGLDFLKYREMILDGLLQTLLVHDDQILVLLQLLAQRPVRLAVFIDLAVDKNVHQRRVDLVHVIHRLFVIVKIEQGDHASLLPVLCAELPKLCLIDKIDHIDDASALRIDRFDQLGVRDQVVQTDPLKVCPQLPVLVGKVDVLVLIRVREDRLRQVREDRHDVSLEPEGPSGHLAHLVVHPQHIAVFVDDDCGDLQLLEHLCLHCSVPAGKPYDRAEDPRPVIEPDEQDRKEVERRECRRCQSRSVVQQIHGCRERNQGEGQIQAPVPVHFQFSAVSNPGSRSHKLSWRINT